MQKIIHWIQHAPFENLGAIQLWCDQRGIQSIQHNIYEENLDFLINININNPEILGFIFMGGPMNVDEHDVYPFLVPEKKFLKNILNTTEKKVLGICLGAQLLANVLDSSITKNQYKEIGFWEIFFNPDIQNINTELLSIFKKFDQKKVAHWHGDIFNLPLGAQQIWHSQACQNQGFIWENRALGLQFHPEMTPMCVAEMIEHCADELENAETTQFPFVQTAQTLRKNAQQYTTIQNKLLFELLDCWFLA